MSSTFGGLAVNSREKDFLRIFGCKPQIRLGCKSQMSHKLTMRNHLHTQTIYAWTTSKFCQIKLKFDVWLRYTKYTKKNFLRGHAHVCIMELDPYQHVTNTQNMFHKWPMVCTQTGCDLQMTCYLQMRASWGTNTKHTSHTNTMHFANTKHWCHKVSCK